MVGEPWLMVCAFCGSLRRGLVEILLQPVVNFLVEVAAVLAFQDPVVLVGPDDEAARNPQSLEHAPVFQRLVEGHTEIVLADRKQNRGAEVLR